MGVHGKPLPFRVNGKVNLSKSTDKITADIGVEPVNVEKVPSNKKQLIKNRDDFVYISILIGIIFICIEFISAKPLFVWLTDLYGVEKGKIVDMLIFMAAGFIFVALEGVMVFLYEEFDNKYAHNE